MDKIISIKISFVYVQFSQAIYWRAIVFQPI